MKIPEWKQSSVDNPDALDRLARNAIWGADGPVDHIRADAAEVRAHQITPREAAGLLRAVERKWNIMDQPWRRATVDKLRAIAERDTE